MDLTWIDVIDTAIKIGLGAIISAVSGYVVLIKTQTHDSFKEEKIQFYKLQSEKKVKYVELLSQSQELIQSHLYNVCLPDSESYKQYLRTYNEVQIISNDQIRIAASQLLNDVSHFIFLNKNQQEKDIEDKMVSAARNKVSIFQKYAQEEVTKSFPLKN